jgi:hypothetical protein
MTAPSSSRPLRRWFSQPVNRGPRRLEAGAVECARHLRTTTHAAEQDRPDVTQRREGWKNRQPDLHARSLIFICKAWAMTDATQLRRRTPVGRRMIDSTSHRDHSGAESHAESQTKASATPRICKNCKSDSNRQATHPCRKALYFQELPTISKDRQLGHVWVKKNPPLSASIDPSLATPAIARTCE